MSEAKIVVRPVKPTDQGLIFSTWLKGQYWGSEYWLRMEQDEYFKLYADHITQYICKPGTAIDCAVLEDAPDVVIGYIVYNDQHLFWSYTKHDFRKQGIFKTLVENMDFVTYSGDTKAGHKIAEKRGLYFNPLKS